MNNRDVLSPAAHEPDNDQIRLIVEFWNQVRICDDAGRTSWEALEPLEREVTECIERRTASDIVRAASLTAAAQLLMAGLVEL